MLLPLAALLLGMVLYLHGFVQTLPYQLEPDEPNLWLFAESFLNTNQLFAREFAYPPLGVIGLALQHRLIYWITPDGRLEMEVFYVFGRVFSTLRGVLLLAVVYQVGRQLHSRAAGVAAMLFLAAQPDAIGMAKVLKVDNLAWLWGMVSLAFAYGAVFTKRNSWLVYSVIAGVLATAAKYTMLPVLVVPGLVITLYMPRSWAVRGLLIAALILSLGLGVSIVVNPPPLLTDFLMRFHARQLYDRGQIFQFVSLARSWPQLLLQFGVMNFWLFVLGFPVAVLIWPRAQLNRQQWFLIGVTLAMMVVTFILLGLFQTNRVQDRYLIVLGFALLWGLLVALWVQKRASLGALVALLLTASWVVQGWQLGTNLRRPDTRALTADWFIANVPQGTHIAMEKDFVEFDRGYGGFPSDKVFFVEEIDSVYDRPLDEFARRGVEYLVADFRNIYRGGFFEPGRDNTEFLSQVETVLDLSRPWDRGWQGPERYVFRIPPIQSTPMHIFLGDAIIFKGYDLDSNTVLSGETLDLVLYWACLRETDADYTVFVHLNSEDGALVAQLDGPPGDALHRTYSWWPGYFDWDEWPVPIPADTSPGRYTLTLGMYDANTLARLPATDANGVALGDEIVLTPITVEARP